MSDDKIVFLDTCVWVELLLTSTPTKPHQIVQAQLASGLMKELKTNNIRIVTCEQQLLELVNAVQRAKTSEFNRKVKKNANGTGVSNAKELRVKYPEDFKSVVGVCKMAISSIKELTTRVDDADVDIDVVLNKLEFADANDCIYYEYCKRNSVILYTFDLEIEKMDDANIVVLLK